eukprot:9478474-Pyramimonas_sp.AAC.2
MWAQHGVTRASAEDVEAYERQHQRQQTDRRHLYRERAERVGLDIGRNPYTDIWWQDEDWDPADDGLVSDETTHAGDEDLSTQTRLLLASLDRMSAALDERDRAGVTRRQHAEATDGTANNDSTAGNPSISSSRQQTVQKHTETDAQKQGNQHNASESDGSDRTRRTPR